MKKLNIFIFIVILSVSNNYVSFAQERTPSIKLSTGFGYYNPFRTGETGNVFFSKLLFRLPSGLYIGGEFAGSLVFNTFEEDDLSFLRGRRTYDNYYMYSLHFEKPFFFGSRKKHELSVSSGFVYIEWKYARIDYYTDFNDPSGLIPLSASRNFGPIKSRGFGLS